jgi:simple sugar transport system ATP-binding protein
MIGQRRPQVVFRMAPVLCTRAITKRFTAVTALDGVDFNAYAGEVHALMGENGAGKSTLVKVITGVYPRDGGDLLLDDKSISPRSTLDAQRLGISTVYQEVNLIPAMSVAENIFLGRAPTRFGFLDRRKMRRDAEEALARLDVKLDVRKPLQRYPIALQQMVAIARSLTMSAKVLILDEPTSSLDRAEVARLFDAMRRFEGAGDGDRLRHPTSSTRCTPSRTGSPSSGTGSSLANRRPRTCRG